MIKAKKFNIYMYTYDTLIHVVATWFNAVNQFLL